ncbi:MAG: ribulose-phosphate 3-epimerase [Anaerotignum propionicum]|uniref:ribulose-phosphate 3-epimerase n=1 Tax=Anaerotignum propionicum TaxID=28446 RepID=UPI002B1FC5A3|nr:ribulose-phosphate 3-epimerase [Anaerotignum propionicum]MEA5058336.1 ribulose-phosphate 3-epimerase [Anaerotignum propionicum]
MAIYLSPSMLSIDFAKIGEQLAIIEQAGTPYIHLDVMDGVFVPNISFGIPVIKGIRKASNMVFDAHLMIVEPEKYVEEFRKAGADIINFHMEATEDPKKVIDLIHSTGAKAGITIKPNTPVEAVKPYLADLEMVLVMTVEPGFGGQKFMENQVPKICKLALWKEEMNLGYDIQVDGGITQDNVRIVLDAGANVIVAGSAVFDKEDIAKAAKDFFEIFKEYE